MRYPTLVNMKLKLLKSGQNWSSNDTESNKENLFERPRKQKEKGKRHVNQVLEESFQLGVAKYSNPETILLLYCEIYFANPDFVY